MKSIPSSDKIKEHKDLSLLFLQLGYVYVILVTVKF